MSARLSREFFLSLSLSLSVLMLQRNMHIAKCANVSSALMCMHIIIMVLYHIIWHAYVCKCLYGAAWYRQHHSDAVWWWSVASDAATVASHVCSCAMWNVWNGCLRIAAHVFNEAVSRHRRRLRVAFDGVGGGYDQRMHMNKQTLCQSYASAGATHNPPTYSTVTNTDLGTMSIWDRFFFANETKLLNPNTLFY